MKTSRKKFYLIIVAIVAVLLVFAGCTKKNVSTSKSKKTKISKSNAQIVKWTKAASKYTASHPYHIVWYTIGTPQKDMPEVQAAINKFLRKKIHAVVDIRMIGFGQYDNKMKVITLSGQPYDLAFTCSWANNFLTNANEGAYLPLNSLLKTYGKGILKNLNPAFLKGPKIDGKIYAIPTNKEVAQQIVYVMPTRLIKKLGFKLSDFTAYKGLDTLKSLYPFMQAIKKYSQKIYPFIWGQDERIEVHNEAYIFGNAKFPGAVIIGKGYKVINQWKNPTLIKELEYQHFLYQKGLISSALASKANVQGMMLQGVGGISAEQYAPDAQIYWGTSYGYPVSVLPKFKPITTTASVTGAMIAISRNAKNPVVDMKFLNLLNTNVYLRNLINYGIAGKQYVKTGKTTIKFLKGHSNYKVSDYTFGNEFLLYTIPGEPVDLWQTYKKWNATAITSQILGFHFNTNSIQTIYTAVVNVADQYAPQLFTGAANPKTVLPKYYKALKEAGVQKLIAAEQSQLNTWVAKQKKLKSE